MLKRISTSYNPPLQKIARENPEALKSVGFQVAHRAVPELIGLWIEFYYGGGAIESSVVHRFAAIEPPGLRVALQEVWKTSMRAVHDYRRAEVVVYHFSSRRHNEIIVEVRFFKKNDSEPWWLWNFALNLEGEFKEGTVTKLKKDED